MALRDNIRTFFGFGDPARNLAPGPGPALFGDLNTYPDGNPALGRQYGPAGAWSWDAGPSRPPVIGVTEEAAVSITAVYRAAQLISSTIASFPLHIHQELPDGTRERFESADSAFLWDEVNPEVSNIVFWETAFGHEVLNGNCYIYVQKRPNGRPLYLWLIEPIRVRCGRDGDGKKIYAIDNIVPMRDFRDGGELVHVTGWGRNTLVGISPIRDMAQTLGLIKAAEEYGARFFAQGTTMGGVLQTDQTLEPEYAALLAATWDKNHASLANAHRTAVMDRGLKYQQTAISPEDAQMLQTRQFQVAEVARMFGVPEFLLGAHDKMSSWGAGLEVNNRAFIQYGLTPHMLRFEQTLTRALLRDRTYARFEMAGLLRGTAQERANYYELMSRIGVYTVNDILRLEDRPEVGPEGDVRYRQTTWAAVEAGTGQPAEAPAVPSAAPPAAPTNLSHP